MNQLYTDTVIGENTGREWVYFYPTEKKVSTGYMAAPRGDGLCDLDKWR
jgi:hypothetical protein